MKIIVTTSIFRDAFNNLSESYKNRFSYDGLTALFNYLEEIDEDYELDPIALCCEFTEYDSVADAYANYNDELEAESELEGKMLEWLNDNTSVITCENGHIIIQNF